MCWTQNLRVAVPTFTARGGFSKDDAEVLTDLFSSYLIEAGGFEVLTRTEVDKLLNEMNFQSSGLTSDTDYAKMGAALNAKAIITGNIMKLSGSSKGYFTISVIEVATFKGLSSSRTEFTELGEIVDKMPTLAKNIISPLAPNPFIGRWQSKVNDYICIIEFKENGSLVVERYDSRSRDDSKTNGYNNFFSGKGTGSYTYDNKNLNIVFTIDKGNQTTFNYSIPYNFNGKNSFNLDQRLVYLTYAYYTSGGIYTGTTDFYYRLFIRQ